MSSFNERRWMMMPSVSLEDGYVADMLHDVKKTLLCNDLSQGKEYGAWAEHLRLDDLEAGLGPADDLSGKRVDLENDAQTLLIKLHHRHFTGEVLGIDPSDPQISNLDTITVISLMTADAMHKALYFSDEVVHKTIDVGRQFPIYYPFYRNPIVWLPVDYRNLPRIDTVRFDRLSGDVRRHNARWIKFRAFQEAIQKRRDGAGNPHQFLNADFLVHLERTLFADFPDTAYLPITSIGFHHRLTAALLFLIYEELVECDISTRTKTIQVPFYLNTIISPPEKLTNRLRDTATVRKISHLLQQKLHTYMKDRYLKGLTRLGFWHPDLNPFFFYNKDAIVLLNGARDQDDIRDCCQRVAEMTESVVIVNSRRVDAKIELVLNERPNSPVKLRDVKLKDFRTYRGELDIRLSEKVKLAPASIQPIWSAPDYSKETPGAEARQMHCYVCNKSVADMLEPDKLGDRLCSTCQMMRDDFQFCYNCQVFFKADEGGCPYDALRGHGFPSSFRLFQETPPIRVAYVLISTNCTYETVKTDADALMARFRLERYKFERGDPAYKGSLQWGLAQTGTTDFGIFEYLQAVLNISQFQTDVERAIRETLSWLRPRRRGSGGTLGGYRINPQDLTDETLSRYFLYRSPMHTLVVVPEGALPKFFRNIEPLLNDLHISHRVRIMACNSNHPVWMVLRELKLTEREPFISDEVEEMSRRINEELAKKVRRSAAEAREKWVRLQKIVRSLQEGVRDARLADLEEGIGRSGNYIEAISRIKGIALLMSQWIEASQLSPEQRELAEQVKGCADELTSSAYTAMEWAKEVFKRSQEFLDKYKGDTRRVPHLKCKELSLTIHRSGIERRFSGKQAYFLLRERPNLNYRVASQLGYLSEFASGLLVELGEGEDASFRDNLLLELDSRTAGKRQERIPDPIAEKLREHIEDRDFSPMQLPGFIREMASYGRFPV